MLQHGGSSSVERMLGLNNIFDMRVDVPALSADEAGDVVRDAANWQWRSGSSDGAADAAAAIVKSTGSVPPLKRLLLALQRASQRSVGEGAAQSSTAAPQTGTTAHAAQNTTPTLCVVENFSACLSDIQCVDADG